MHEQQLFCTREYLLSYYIDHFIGSNRHKGRTWQISKMIVEEGIKGNTGDSRTVFARMERENVRETCGQ